MAVSGKKQGLSVNNIKVLDIEIQRVFLLSFFYDLYCLISFKFIFNAENVLDIMYQIISKIRKYSLQVI